MDQETDKTLTARDISRERHARKLIEAAQDAICAYGVRGATIARIQEFSGLSRGMINARFDSKERLLEAAIRDMSAAYTGRWQRALAAAGDDPVSRLRALIRADFSPEVLNERHVTLWFAFRAEAKPRDEYLSYITTREEPITSIVTGLCVDLAEATGRGPDEGRRAATLLMAALEGFWADFHLYPQDFDRDAAAQLAWDLLARFFPERISGQITDA